MTSLAELQERYGPTVVVAPYGESIVVPGAEFNPDWEAELGDQGFNCHLGNYNGKAVTFVPTKKAVAPGKVVSVPPKPKDPPAAAAESKRVNWTSKEDAFISELWNHGLKVPAIAAKVEEKFPIRKGNATNMRLKRLRIEGTIQPRNNSNQVKKLEEIEEKVEAKQNRGNTHPKMPWLKDAKFWLPEEDDVIIKLWNKGVSLEEIGVVGHKQIPVRTEKAIMKRVYALQKKGKIERRWKTKKGKKNTVQHSATQRNVAPHIEGLKAEDPAPAESTSSPNGKEVTVLESVADGEKQIEEIVDNIEKYVDNRLEEILKKLTAFDELKEDFEAYTKMQAEITDAHREYLNNLTKKAGLLERELAKHKHLEKTGEAVLPMEVS